LCEDLRKLEDVAADVAPAWTGISVSELIRSFDGKRLLQHWAHAGGVNHFFGTLTELENFKELQRALLRAGEKLRVYEGPEGEQQREGSHISVAHLAHTDELQKVLTSLEAKGLTFRGGGEWRVLGGKEVQTCTEPLGLAAAMRKGAQSEIDIQRYKGLGEMDAAQLWESTMDPTRRTLYKVEMEDAMAADEIFTILMSDGVEARRDYIDRHALEATNLDV
jgi:DNA gyrase/topoisomerase IV subunit B